MWGFCGCNRRRNEEVREVREIRDEREWVTVRSSCSKKKDDSNRENDTSVSPASSFCQRQLEAAETGCRANPRTNFSGCRAPY